MNTYGDLQTKNKSRFLSESSKPIVPRLHVHASESKELCSFKSKIYIEQFLTVVLFTTLPKVVQSFESVDEP